MAAPEELLRPRSFGDRLVLVLRHRRMTVRSLARETGIPERSLYSYIRDHTPPSNARVEAIARAVGVSPNDLLGWDSASGGTPPYLSSPLAA